MKTNFITRPKVYKNHWMTKPPCGTQIDWTNPLTKGLVGCWLFNEGSGLRANDLSGNKNHGTLTLFEPFSSTSGWTGGKHGTSLQFNGLNDNVNAGNAASLNLGNTITVEAWVKPAVDMSISDTIQYRIVNKFTYPNNGWYFLYQSLTNQFSFSTYDGTGHSALYSIIPTINTLYHVVAVSNGTTNIVYVNGIAGTPNASGTLTNSTGNLTISGNTTNFTWNGSIDEVRIWNRALSSEEIKQLYAQPYDMFKY